MRSNWQQRKEKNAKIQKYKLTQLLQIGPNPIKPIAQALKSCHDKPEHMYEHLTYY